MTSRLRALRAVASDLRCRIRREGLGPVLRKVGHWVRSRSSEGSELMVLAKDLNQIVTSERRSRLRLEEIEPRQLPLLYDLNRRRCFTRANRRFAEDVARGYRGFVAFMDEELMGYYWWVDSSDPLHRDLVRLGLGIELDDGDVYGSDFFILDEYRGGGAANDFLDELETTLKERGYGRLWGYVESTNRPARWIYSARGYEAVRTVTKRR